MGQCCGKDDDGSSAGRRRTNTSTHSTFDHQQLEAAYNQDGNAVKHMTKQEDTVTASTPPSPPRGAANTNTNNKNSSQSQSPTKFNSSQSPVRSAQLTLEPVNQSQEDALNHPTSNPRNQRALSSPMTNNNGSNINKVQTEEELLEAGAMARTNFLKHVNGNQSHSVARVLLEQWCIILNAIKKEDEALLLLDDPSAAASNNKNIIATDNNDDDLDLDGFGSTATGGSTNASTAKGGNNNNTNNSHHHNKEIFFNQKMFGEGVDVSHSASSTKIEKWATQHASEAVTHESVEEVVQAFLPYLREETRIFGWGGEFSYQQQGFDVTGVLEVEIKLVRFDGEESPHTYEIVVNYHAISLL